ncbi:GGDEF domain-containing protein [Cytobacillus suaedae]|nr:GGDEF domain-containing protein [Cytobacillus suaedae]
MLRNKGLKLQLAISLLVITTIVLTIVVNLYSSAQALRASLTENYLTSNQKYASKLSTSASDLLHHMQGNINALGKMSSQKSLSQEELDHWRSAIKNHFNSIFIVNPEGVVQTMSPKVVQFNKKVLAGTKLQTETMKYALALKKPFISEPYHGTSGQLIVLISSPVFDEAGVYKGLVAGTIYLEKENAINTMLNDHELGNSSYVYVVDSQGKILYHPETSRINEDVSSNTVVQHVLRGERGAIEVTNSQGENFFAGYASMKNTGWGIISQTPITVVEKPMKELMKKVILQSLPLLLIIVVLAWILTRNLAKPLSTLAKYSEAAITQKKLPTPLKNNKSSIYEVRQLYHHLFNHINLLNTQIQLDGLTGLANRRSFDIEIQSLIEHNQPFTIMMIDIDKFKLVNDTYGHLVGDDVLKYLATMMNLYSSENTIGFRYGGEEFGMLIKDTSLEDTVQIAEQLRKTVADTPSPTGQPITISLGISQYHIKDQHPETIIKRADTALYQSKQNGRNRTTVYEEKKVPIHA